jgi:hypothetical protein
LKHTGLIFERRRLLRLAVQAIALLRDIRPVVRVVEQIERFEHPFDGDIADHRGSGGWRASFTRSVIGRAEPPATGIVQSVPCRSNTSVLPSGDAATAIDVPSLTTTSRGETGFDRSASSAPPRETTG